MGSEVDLDAFPRATDELLARRALLRRSDSKFLGRDDAVPSLLAGLTADYALLGAAFYATLYFDTADRRFFHDHRRGRRIRHKVRIRHYDDRRLTFLEVKSRTSDVTTLKHRVELPYETEALGPAEQAFVEERTGVPGAALRPALWILYQRITLLSLGYNERFTIDRGLHVAAAHDRAEVIHRVEDVVFIEVKQAPRSRGTPVIQRLRGLGLRERSISKYCAGVIYADPAVRHNRLRPVMRALEGPRP